MNKSIQDTLALYQTDTGALKLKSDVEKDTIWANLKQISRLFDRDKSTISRHIKNIFEEGELDESSTVAFFATVQKEGSRKVKREVKYYNLDMILSVGYQD